MQKFSFFLILRTYYYIIHTHICNFTHVYSCALHSCKTRLEKWYPVFHSAILCYTCAQFSRFYICVSIEVIIDSMMMDITRWCMTMSIMVIPRYEIRPISINITSSVCQSLCGSRQAHVFVTSWSAYRVFHFRRKTGSFSQIVLTH